MSKEEYKNEAKKEFKSYMLDILEDSSIINNISYNEILDICYEVLDELKMLDKSKNLNTEIKKYFKY